MLRLRIKALCSDPSRPPLSCPLCQDSASPHEGGDWPSSLISPTTILAKRTLSAKLPISPQVGEMSGRTEGGAVPPRSKVLHRSSAPRSPHGSQGLRRVASLLAPLCDDEVEGVYRPISNVSIATDGNYRGSLPIGPDLSNSLCRGYQMVAIPVSNKSVEEPAFCRGFAECCVGLGRHVVVIIAISAWDKPYGEGPRRRIVIHALDSS